MGNSVTEWRAGHKDGFRDRFRTVIDGSAISAYYTTGQQPSQTAYAAGSASRIIDHNHILFHKLMQYRASGEIPRAFDYGSALSLERVSLSMPSIISTEATVYKENKAFFDGVFAPTAEYRLAMGNVAQGRFPAIPTSVGADMLYLKGLGSTAIARSLPDVPEFSLFRFIGELKAGLPKVPLQVLAKQRKLRNVGGEYLNVQFGLLPTISDLEKLIRLLQNPELRRAVKRDLGQETRVRKTIDKGREKTSRALTSTEMNSLTSNFSSGVTGHLDLVREFRIWSSCSFAYHQVTLLEQLLADLDENLGSLGLVPDWIDAWNLTPWSWLVDWFTNFNHVITNLSYLGRDGLYLQRGYVMATYREVETTTQSRTYMGSRISTTGTRTYERKYRVKASPFGFGLTWKDFDPFQLSILGALGVSRMRF